MKFDIEHFMNIPRKSSKDYLELMHHALEKDDKEWFEELTIEKQRIEDIEVEVRKA
ncbi:hypothetical protein [Bacillus sp. NPDC093026]|uniref:hypothetical protein n=1 Tax=Bacillus sp. NPDC093026 TaxID=3363948 RepID=UPI0037FCD0C6